MNYDWNGQVVGTVHEGLVTIRSSEKTISNILHMEALDAGKEMYEVVGLSGGIGLDGMVEVDISASEGQSAGVYEVGFATGPFAGIRVRGKLGGLRIKYILTTS